MGAREGQLAPDVGHRLRLQKAGARSVLRETCPSGLGPQAVVGAAQFSEPQRGRSGQA